MVDAHAAAVQGHGGRTKAEGAEFGQRIVRHGPRHAQRCAHRHTQRTAVQRVAGGGGEHHRVGAKGCHAAKHGAHIRAVGHAVEHHHAAGRAAHFGHAPGLRTAESAEHAACESVACERREHLAATRKHGHLRAACHEGCGVALQVLLLAQQSRGREAYIEGGGDDFGTLGHKEGGRGVEAVAQLCLGEATEHGHAGVVDRGNLYGC